MNVMERIHKIRIVPVVVLNKLEDTIPTLKALINGDVPVAEICFRTDCAEECIKKAVEELNDEILIGAGTVINKEQANRAIKAGVKFIVSPGFSEGVFEACRDNNIPYLPGVVSPTEIMNAMEHGISIVKFFPAGVFGGLKAIKALSSAFPSIRFMPTGGVDNSNLKEFIVNEKIYACGGSWIVKGTAEEITKLCLEARKIVKEV